jgi:hypothetical protein
MKPKKNCIYILISLLILSTSSGLFAQGESIDQVTIFSSRLKKPIDVELRTDQGNIYFNVQNHSYYPYNFEVKFGAMSNLSPQVYSRRAKVFPGNTRLITFKIVDPSQQPIINYQISYSLAGTIASEEKFKPYLIPIGENRTVQFLIEKGENSNKLYLNHYNMSPGDTVFNSRKGIVTALPDNTIESDRIMEKNSLEILHDDGTVAIYQGISSGSKLIKLGQKVYPGQPIGIMGSSKLLKFLVLELQYDGRIKTLNILYSGSDDKNIPPQNINGIKVFYSDKTITQELNKKESSRHKNGTLY